MYKLVIDLLNSNNVLTEEQFGFRKGQSTDKALYIFLNEILCALKDKMHVGGIFCDLAKAFDCVNHDILLSKLNFYGIKGNAEQWFKSHLNGRKQTEIKSPNSNSNSHSNWDIEKHGVPQGSIFGLLFLLYINDLRQIINSLSKPKLFADDTSIIIHHPDSDYFQNYINDVFTGLNNWFKANKLILNFDKTNFMKFTTNNKTSINLNIGYDNKTTEEVLTTKFLGLQIDNNLNWKKHIQYFFPKLISACFPMRTVTPLLKVDTLKLIYFAYFHSIMSKTVNFWGNSTDSKEYLSSKRKPLEQ
jgi:hypothetical protein